MSWRDGHSRLLSSRHRCVLAHNHTPSTHPGIKVLTPQGGTEVLRGAPGRCVLRGRLLLLHALHFHRTPQGGTEVHDGRARDRNHSRSSGLGVSCEATNAQGRTPWAGAQAEHGMRSAGMCAQNTSDQVACRTQVRGVSMLTWM
jgi:hypothetical protein